MCVPVHVRPRPTVCFSSVSLAEICLLGLEVSSVLDMCCQKPAVVSHQS